MWMRPIIKNIKYCFLIFLLLTACTELYEPDISTDSDLIVIKGTLTNKAGYAHVRVSKASPYGQNNNMEPVQVAQVNVENNEQESIPFEKVGTGHFRSVSSNIKGEPGKTYTLEITLENGKKFVSDPQTMPMPQDRIGNVKAFRETENIKYVNTNGDLSSRTIEGAQMYADIPMQPQGNYRITWQAWLQVTNRIVFYFPPGASDGKEIPFYYWDRYSFEDVLLVNNPNNAPKTARNFETFFFRNDAVYYDSLNIPERFEEPIFNEYFPDSTMPETQVGKDSFFIMLQPGFKGWIVQLKQHALTQQAYQYYSDIKKLEESEGEIFDPINTQIRGNMRCVSDSTQKVVGLFEVASISRSSFFVEFNEFGSDELFTKSRDSVYNISKTGWQDSVPPAFWMNR